jgi:hypothetical protein
MKTSRNTNGVITAITHQNSTVVIAIQYRDIIIIAVRTVDNGVRDVKQKETWAKVKIHAVPQVRYIRKGTEGLKKMGEEFEVENEGVAIPTPVRWLGNRRTISERRQNGEIASLIGSLRCPGRQGGP